MANINKKFIPSLSELPTYLAAISPEERRVWVQQLKTRLDKGDYKKIAKRVNASKKVEGYEVTRANVEWVMRGGSYNPNYGPIVIEKLIELISEKDKKVKEAYSLASSFMLNNFN